MVCSNINGIDLGETALSSTTRRQPDLRSPLGVRRGEETRRTGCPTPGPASVPFGRVTLGRAMPGSASSVLYNWCFNNLRTLRDLVQDRPPPHAPRWRTGLAQSGTSAPVAPSAVVRSGLAAGGVRLLLRQEGPSRRLLRPRWPLKLEQLRWPAHAPACSSGFEQELEAGGACGWFEQEKRRTSSVRLPCRPRTWPPASPRVEELGRKAA